MPEPHDEGKMPPIPDGGLSESMPEWLRRPPAWRTLRDTDVVQTEPVAAERLPEPDPSVIDPRTFLADDDLPLWLRNMGRGRTSRRDLPGDDDAAEVPNQAGPAPVEDRAGHTSASQAKAATPAPSQTPSRFVPRSPAPVSPARPVAPGDRVTRSTPNGRDHRAPWWQGTAMVVLLAVLLLVAVGVIVFLLVY